MSFHFNFLISDSDKLKCLTFRKARSIYTQCELIFFARLYHPVWDTQIELRSNRRSII